MIEALFQQTALPNLHPALVHFPIALPAPAGKDGLSLFASGRTLLRLPGEWEDVQMVLRLDASEFAGSVALGARADGESGGASP
jgi:uncharacterized membrane protein